MYIYTAHTEYGYTDTVYYKYEGAYRRSQAPSNDEKFLRKIPPIAMTTVGRPLWLKWLTPTPAPPPLRFSKYAAGFKVEISLFSHASAMTVFSTAAFVAMTWLLYIMKYFIDTEHFWWPKVVVSRID